MEALAEYTVRRDRWRAERQILERQFNRIGNWRLTLGIAEVALACLVFGPHWLTPWILAIPAVAFIVLVVVHQRILRRRTRAGRAMAHYERGLARLEDRWPGNGNQGERFRDTGHVYADDLDVFGKGSLFELLATTRTAAGDKKLADWLLRPASRDEALARQAAVRELSTCLELHQDLALLGDDVRAEVHIDAIDTWASSGAVPFSAPLRALLPLLAVTGVVALVSAFAQAIPLWPFAAVLGCDFLVIWMLRDRVARVVGAIHTPAQSLQIVSLMLQRLERERFESARLKELRVALDIEGIPASQRIARLTRWMDWLDSSDHLLIRVIRPVVLWQEQIAIPIELWRRENGPHLRRWLEAVAEMEALSALASLAYERPEWCFPTLTNSLEPCLEAIGLQHPLMSPAKCVPNDVRLGENLRLLIVSGSNMSGKSTLLRSVGLNCVLAWAGAPVAARSLHVSALQPGASMRAVDSLQDNHSRFFAEISRIRQIFDLTKDGRRVLFLLDELLSGTNSHDRRVGAAGLVRELVANGAIGLITTHDLALAEIEQDLEGAAANVHFDDQITGGRVGFDYRLRPGVVTRSNALELMRLIGLPV